LIDNTKEQENNFRSLQKSGLYTSKVNKVTGTIRTYLTGKNLNRRQYLKTKMGVRKMRILVIRPVVNTPEEIRRRRLIHLRRLAFSGTKIEMVDIDKGPTVIQSDYDVAIAAPEILRKVKEAEEKSFDAVIISCAMDPALSACRQIAKIPVVGMGESSHLMASSLGHRYSIITAGEKEEVASGYYKIVRKLGFNSRLASIRRINLPILDIQKNLENTKKMFIEEARKAIKEDGADVIVPGCGYFSELAKELQRELGIPVIDPAGVALKTAETLVSLGLTHSKIAYPYPSAYE